MEAIKTLGRIVALIVILAITVYVLFFIKERANNRLSLESTSETTASEPRASSTPDTIPVVVEKISKQASSSPQISVEYPRFPTLRTSFNEEIRQSVMRRLISFEEQAGDDLDFSFTASFDMAQTGPRYVSFVMRFDSYTGGANSNQEIQTFNHDVRSGRAFGISDVIGTSSESLVRLSVAVRRQLSESLVQANGGQPIETAYLTEGTAPVESNYKLFTFTDDAITVYFPKYHVAPGSFGEQRASIPRSSLYP